MLGTEAWAEAPARRGDTEEAATRAVGWGQQGWQYGKDGGQAEERPSCLTALQLVLGGSEDDIIDSLVCPITHEVGLCFVRVILKFVSYLNCCVLCACCARTAWDFILLLVTPAYRQCALWHTRANVDGVAVQVLREPVVAADGAPRTWSLCREVSV